MRFSPLFSAEGDFNGKLTEFVFFSVLDTYDILTLSAPTNVFRFLFYFFLSQFQKKYSTGHTTTTKPNKQTMANKKSIFIFELMLLCTVLGRTLAKIGTQERSMNSLGPNRLSQYGNGGSGGGDVKMQNQPQIRFSRSPANQIRFGRSQPFVRFGRDGEQTSQSTDKFIRFARNGLDDNIRTRQQGQESKFIRFGRSQKGGAVGPIKNDDGRSSLWWNFYRLARNPNAHIRFAGKRDGGAANSNNLHHNTAIPIEMLLEKYSHEPTQQQQQQQQSSIHTSDGLRDAQDTEHNILTDDDEQIDDIVDPDQFQSNSYSNGNDLE